MSPSFGANMRNTALTYFAHSGAMAGRGAIIPDMTIFGSDGVPVGRVHRVSGIRIVVDRIGVTDTDLFYIPLSWVSDVTDRVTLDRPAADARPERDEHDERGLRRSVLIATLAVIPLIGFGLVFGIRAMIQQGQSPAADRPVVAVNAAPPAAPAPPAVPKRPPAAASAAPSAPVFAGSRLMISYLESDAPVPRGFPIDPVAFAPKPVAAPPAPGSPPPAAVPGATGIDAIARMMATHLNTRIKLAVLPGAGAVARRRAEAMRMALIGRGIAPWRIATGPARVAHGPSKSGVVLVVLAK
jgi:hypothetical protein